MRRRILPLLAATGSALLLVACQSPPPDAGTTGTAPPAPHAVLDLPSAAQELAIDAATGTAWLATVRSAGADTLWSVDLGSGEARSFDLPDADGNGYTTHVRVGPDGAVWVSLPYTLARWDPASGAVTSIRFDKAADGALPDAFDPGTTLPGTWLSGILPDGTGVLLARNHVPYLTRVSNALEVSRGPAVASGYAGAADLVRDDGRVLLFPALDNPAEGVKVLGGTEISGTAQRGPQRFLVDGAIVSALSQDESMTVVASASDHPGTHELWTRTNGDGTSVRYDPAGGTLLRTAPDGSQDVLRLERFEGQTSGGGIDPATGEQRSADTSIAVWDRLTDFVVAADGSVWLLRHGGTQLVRWGA